MTLEGAAQGLSTIATNVRAMMHQARAQRAGHPELYILLPGGGAWWSPCSAGAGAGTEPAWTAMCIPDPVSCCIYCRRGAWDRMRALERSRHTSDDGRGTVWGCSPEARGACLNASAQLDDFFDITVAMLRSTGQWQCQCHAGSGAHRHRIHVKPYRYTAYAYVYRVPRASSSLDSRSRTVHAWHGT